MIRALLVTSFLSFAPAAALAAKPDPTAAAQKAVAEGDFEAALKLVDRELKKKHPAEVAAQLHLIAGQSHAVLQNVDRAKDAFRSALELDPEVTLNPESTPPDQIELFESARATVQGDVQILSNRDGATVRIDGKPYGPVPLTLRLPVGRHDVEVTAGSQKKVEQVVVAAKGTRTLRVELPPDAPVATAPRDDASLRATSTPPAGGAARPQSSTSGASSSLSTTAPSEPRGSVVPGVAMIVGGLALAGGGTWGTLYALDIKKDFDAQQAPGAVPTVTRADAARARVVFPASIGAAVAGAGLVVSGVVAIATRGGGDDDASALHVVPTRDGGALVFGGSF